MLFIFKNMVGMELMLEANKEGVNAKFCPFTEKLAFHLQANEFDLPGIYSEPLKIVIETLMQFKTYNEMINNFPDIEILK